MKKTFVFETLPGNAEELKAWSGFNLTDPYTVAAMTIVALRAYAEGEDTCMAMLDAIKGPEKINPFQRQLIRDQLKARDYLVLSYFNGANPDNNYIPALPYTIEIEDGVYSDAQQGYKKLFVRSGGADTERQIILRNKPSTGEWFLWEYTNLIMGIREPKAADPWA